MFNQELIAAKVAARNAGKILMKYYKSEDNEVKMKGIDNPVTIADNEADKYLSEFLIGEFPDDGWLSEETVDTKKRLSKNRVWIVDPLDGTKEFIEGIPHFSVSIVHRNLLVFTGFASSTHCVVSALRFFRSCVPRNSQSIFHAQSQILLDFHSYLANF